MIKVGSRIINENPYIYAKKCGIGTFSCSAMALTIKFGPLPMYVIEPKKTHPVAIPSSKCSGMPPTITGSVNKFGC